MCNKEDLISVIIPNYNCEKYIKLCVESILCQTYKNYEIIIIDDGSIDNSVNIIKELIYENSQKSIMLIEQYNQNAAVARNRGLEIAKGKYIFFIDSDDQVYDKFVFEKMVDSIEYADLLIGNYSIVDSYGDTIRNYKVNNDRLVDVNTKYKYCLISPVPSNKLYKKNIIEDNKIYFDNVRIGQDLNFYLKYLSVSENIKIFDYNIYKYRILSDSMSRKISLNIFDIRNSFDGIKKFYNNKKQIDNYYKYISLVELFHYSTQMEKQVICDDYNTKKIIYEYFIHNIKNVKLDKIYKDSNFSEIQKKIIFKRYFKLLYLSKSYHKIKNILQRNK